MGAILVTADCSCVHPTILLSESAALDESGKLDVQISLNSPQKYICFCNVLCNVLVFLKRVLLNLSLIHAHLRSSWGLY